MIQNKPVKPVIPGNSDYADTSGGLFNIGLICNTLHAPQLTVLDRVMRAYEPLIAHDAVNAIAQDLTEASPVQSLFTRHQCQETILQGISLVNTLGELSAAFKTDPVGIH